MISDRFVVTAAHCVSEFTDAQKRELTRTIVIRDDTQFEEIFEVKRHFLHPMYRFPLLYNDVAVFELERKIVYDFDKYGDSPVCLGQDFDIQNQKALAQGFGKTEDDILPDTLLETFVQTVSNQECRDWINYNLTIFPKVKKGVTNSYCLGINDALLCTVGIYNPDKEIYSVL